MLSSTGTVLKKGASLHMRTVNVCIHNKIHACVHTELSGDATRIAKSWWCNGTAAGSLVVVSPPMA